MGHHKLYISQHTRSGIHGNEIYTLDMSGKELEQYDNYFCNFVWKQYNSLWCQGFGILGIGLELRSLQWWLMRASITKERLIAFMFKKTLCISLSQPQATSNPIQRIPKWSIAIQCKLYMYVPCIRQVIVVITMMLMKMKAFKNCDNALVLYRCF